MRGVLGRVRDKDNQSQTDRDRGINIALERTGMTDVDKSQQITIICRLLVPCFAFFLFFSLFVLS